MSDNPNIDPSFFGQGGDLLYVSDGYRLFPGELINAMIYVINSQLAAITHVINFRDFCPPGGGDGQVACDIAWQRIYDAFPQGSIVIEGGGFSNYYLFEDPVEPPAGFSNVILRNFHFYSPFHDHDFLILSDQIAGWVLENPYFTSDSGAGGATLRWCVASDSDNFICINAFGLNLWSGFLLTGPKQYLQGRTYLQNIKAAEGIGVYIDQGTNEICEVDNLVLINGTDSFAGVQIASGNAIVLGGSVNKAGTPLLVSPGMGQNIATLVLKNFGGDTSSGNGARFTGAGDIYRVEGTARFSSNLGNGIDMENIPQSCDLWLRLVDNGVAGFNGHGGDYANSRFRVAAYGNGTFGVAFLDGSSNFNAEVVGGDGDGFGGNGQYDLVIGAGCDHFTCSVNSTGSPNQLFNDSGTGATKVVTARN